MKRLIGLFLVLGTLVLAGQAGAELSTNLKTVVVYDWKVRNKPATETYVDADGNPVIASDKGYATIRYTYEGKNHRIATIELLDTEGNLINGTDGYARMERKYSIGGRTVRDQRYFDADGNPVNGPEGYAKHEEKTAAGRYKEVWEYDADGNPVNNHEIILYDAGTRIKSDSWYDVDNNPVIGPNGYARMEIEYVGKTQSQVSYYDELGNLLFYKKAGYARMEREFDGTRVTAVRYYGADGEMIAGPDGYACAKYSYFANQRKRTMYYTAEGNLYYNKKGICGIETLTSNALKEEYYFIGENVRGRSTDGYSGVRRRYSGYGQIITVQYLDENDQPMTVEKLGYAQLRNNYIFKNKLTDTEYMGPDGQPMLNPDGYAYMVNEYQDKKLVSTTYYDTDKITPINIKAGYAKMTYERDEAGNIIKTDWFDADGNPCAGEAGAEEVRAEWEGKNKISESYWNANDFPVIGKDGYYEVRTEYNGSGKVIRQSYYDLRLELVDLQDGYAVIETEYNSQGDKMSTRYYNKAGQLILTPGKEYAYVKTALMRDLNALEADEADEAYDETDEEGEAQSGDEDDDTEGTEPEEEQPEMMAAEAEDADEEEGGEDEAGDETLQINAKSTITEYYGTDDRLMNIAAGYARVEKVTNAAGMVTRESYFDAEGKAVNLAAGYAVIEREYDERNALTKEAYYDADGARATLVEGYHCYTRENDYQGLALVTAYYDADGRPAVNSKTKYHRVEKTYRDEKHITSEAWFGPDGTPVATGDTYVRIERIFDGRGNATDVKTYDAKGRLTERKEGYDEIQTLYDGNGRAIQTGYYTNGKLKDNIYGVAVTQRTYDEQGNMTAEWYLNAEGETTTHSKNRYHRIEKTYLDAKHVTSEAWFDPWGKPVTNGDSYVRIKREFD